MSDIILTAISIHSKKKNKDYYALVAFNLKSKDYVIVKWLSKFEFDKIKQEN